MLQKITLKHERELPKDFYLGPLLKISPCERPLVS